MNDVSLNLVVIRSPDIDRACRFYSALGLAFTKHAHGTGPEHYACELNDLVFEIYPRKSDADSTTATDFRVPSVDAAVASLQPLGAKVISPPKESPWAAGLLLTIRMVTASNWWQRVRPVESPEMPP